MIITEPVPNSPVKDILPNHSQGGSKPSPPPPYAAYQTPPARPELIVNSIPLRESVQRRFLKALGISLLICFLFGMLSGSMDRLHRWSHHHRSQWFQTSVDESPIPPGTHTRQCTENGDWSDGGSSSAYPYSSSVSFDLPVSSDALFLLARGSLATGDVEILQTGQAGDVVTVDVTMGYYQADALSRAQVCSITREGGEDGVGIFTPVHWEQHSWRDMLHFHVTLHLPASSGSSPLLIQKLATDLPNFSHQLRRLGDTVKFQTLHLKGSNKPISVVSLNAENAELRTSNSPIEGSFVASKSLSLITSNAHVKVAVDLQNRNARRSTQLTIKTSNALVHSTIKLLSSNASDGQYDINVTTSNAALDVEFPVSPVDSTLKLTAGTSNGPATIALHPAYEGEFSLRSSVFAPILEERDVEDPSGNGRPRIVERNRGGKRYLDGKVHYRPSGPAAGRVDVQSSNAKVTVKV